MATLVQSDTLDIVEHFPGVVRSDGRNGYGGWIVEKDSLVQVATAIRDDFGFDLLSSVTGVDYHPDSMEVVYHAFKTTGGPGIVFKVQVHRLHRFGPGLSFRNAKSGISSESNLQTTQTCAAS